jgi:hypothetical protein
VNEGFAAVVRALKAARQKALRETIRSAGRENERPVPGV